MIQAYMDMRGEETRLVLRYRPRPLQPMRQPALEVMLWVRNDDLRTLNADTYALISEMVGMFGEATHSMREAEDQMALLLSMWPRRAPSQEVSRDPSPD